ncbi:MAG TPA: CDP-glycerol glycerophosphotransferase family protein [Longimicrobiaceae bacterium]
MIKLVMRVLRGVRSVLESWGRAVAFVPMERLLPVDRRLWCFGCFGDYPHTLDNPRAVFEQVKDDPSIRKVVLTRGAHPSRIVGDGVNVRFVEADSLRGMYYLARAGAVLVGYGLANLASYSRHLTAKHRVVQLWHGIPLKRIGHLFPGEGWWNGETPRYAATVCSSDADREVMRQAFAPIPRERVWVTGLPRNDFITGHEERLPRDYREVLADLRAKLAGRRLVLYAPTWRENAADLYAFSAEEIAALEGVLRAHDAVLGIRGHALARHVGTSTHGSDAVLDLNGVPDVNVLLRLTDVLVTDYSSIYIDFLVTGRPILHFVYDLERYQGERGLLYTPAQAFGGAALESFGELLAGLDRALSDPAADAGQRERARRLFHSHAGDCGRAVAERVRELLAAPEPAAVVQAVAAVSQ